ncbi:MAG: sigma 54-interacting transcriptional regulator [Desulfarculaceae bacterium]|nr:sigma 54-interacting transcriptional regulator [Desulfarculaceae bacterium]MCF8047865.1 sigma 54-interacting transcriptional regulator [Desulfarculaceae bacterium]MCF8065414.1 sigma 54-interacting transcriptional regulator [Desulfarculaceae bacterium]MCF8097431.1 sigma 54-interacting transcriptional regulator [Desulfarculaceae bacterium]MCF8123315.1 sigma 54-interacting transcriptional regulator [Desulfarculaceae bacterium]
MHLQQRISELEEQLAMSDLVFDHIQNGALVTDPDGIILRFNRPYAEFLGMELSQLIGHNVVDVVDNTRMHIVAQTGQPESMIIQRIKGKDLVVQRIPIKKNGKVTAVFGQVMFKNLKEIQALAKTLEMMESRVRMYEQELTALRRARYTMDSIKGVSDTMVRLRREAAQAATHSLPVLITGESGTGKEVFAQAIHNAGARRHHSFVRINCAAIPHDLFESELFGYAKGAFTGALSQGKPGKFELAGQGTIFLDEIGEMPLEMQPKLLQVLEERVFERVGGVKPIQARCRIIAATNRDLGQLMAEGGFRKDLFFRLNVVPIQITPLRQRREDILPISSHLLEQISQDFGQARYTVSERAAAILKSYDWPGNARELFNVLERTLSLMEGGEIQRENLPLYLRKESSLASTDNNWDLKGIIGRTEKKVLAEALAFTNNNKAQASKLLGIDRTVLYRKMKKHNIPV